MSCHAGFELQSEIASGFIAIFSVLVLMFNMLSDALVPVEVCTSPKGAIRALNFLTLCQQGSINIQFIQNIHADKC